jgi:hypothetical protein
MAMKTILILSIVLLSCSSPRLASGYKMTAKDMRHEITQYLNEQYINYCKCETLKTLVIKAVKEGYSLSDEMLKVDKGIYVPSKQDLE